MSSIQTVTWDSITKGASATLSNGNLTVVIPNSINGVRASIGKSKAVGKYYWEVSITSTGVGGVLVGIVNSLVTMNEHHFTTSNVRGYYITNGYRYPEATAYGASYKAGDTIGVAMDLDNGTLTFYKNGVSQGVSHTNIKDLFLGGEIYPYVTSGSSTVGHTSTVNFGATAFKYSIPEGYLPYEKHLNPHKFLLLSNGKTASMADSKPIYYVNNMTSQVLPSPKIVIMSGHYSATHTGWKAFNGNGGVDQWLTVNNSLVGWLGMNFGEPTKVSIFSITTSNGYLTSNPKDFKLEGSNDGSNWIELLNITNQINWIANEKREFELRETYLYSQYRVRVTANNGNASYSAIAELEFGYCDKYIINIPFPSEKNFINYGIDSPVENLNSIFKNKNYILQDGVSEDTDGLWKTKLNRKPLSIKFE